MARHVKAVPPGDLRPSGRQKGADYTVPEVALLLGCHANTVLRLIKRGHLAAYQLFREYRITGADLQAFRKRRREEAARTDDAGS